MEYKNWSNFNPDSPDNYEHPTGVSMTVPDESFTIAELFQRAAQGLPITTREKDAVYNEDYWHPSEDGDYDLADYHSEVLELQARRRSLQEASKAQKDDKPDSVSRSDAKQSDTNTDGVKSDDGDA